MIDWQANERTWLFEKRAEIQPMKSSQSSQENEAIWIMKNKKPTDLEPMGLVFEFLLKNKL